MKKSFPMEDPKHKPARVVEGIKATVRKYLKREIRKELPEGVDFWDFDCRTGKDAESAAEVHVSKITEGVDEASKEGWEAVYIEILAKPGHRTAKKKVVKTSQDTDRWTRRRRLRLKRRSDWLENFTNDLATKVIGKVNRAS